MRRATLTTAALSVAVTLTACQSNVQVPGPLETLHTSTTEPGTPDEGPTIDVAALDTIEGGTPVDVAGVTLVVPPGLEHEISHTGELTQLVLTEPGRQRAVLVLTLTPRPGYTDDDVAASRIVTERLLLSSGLTTDITTHPATWSNLEATSALRVALNVDGQAYDVLYVVGRDAGASVLIGAHVEAAPGSLESTAAYAALRTIRATT